MSPVALIFGLSLVGTPTAIVDSVTGVPGLRPFELLDAGTEITVATNGRVRLAYFSSCVHETISGGRVRVGVTASLVADATVERVTADCVVPGRGDHITGAPAALLLRDSARTGRPDPVTRIRTTTPVLVGYPGSRVDLERVDVDHRPVSLWLDGRTLSLAGSGHSLVPAATYRICVQGSCRMVWIDPAARVGDGPILERTIRVAR